MHHTVEGQLILNESYAAFLKGSFPLGLNSNHLLLQDPKGILQRNMQAKFKREDPRSWKKFSGNPNWAASVLQQTPPTSWAPLNNFTFTIEFLGIDRSLKKMPIINRTHLSF